MGSIKKYQAGLSLEYINFDPNTESTVSSNVQSNVPAYKDVNGNSRTTIALYTSSFNAKECRRNTTPYSFLKAVASTETLSQYNVSNYALNSVGSADYSAASSGEAKTITVGVTNNTASSITVGSIKFYKTINWSTNSQPNCTCDVLICAYFFDEPKVLEPNEEFTTAIKFDFGAEGET